MASNFSDQLPKADTCGLLLNELQIIWDELGESDAEKEKMLYELEQECLNLYRRKVDKANQHRAHLRRAIADAEAEMTAICFAIGEPSVPIRLSNTNAGSLKEELQAITLKLEEIQNKKNERLNQFIEVMDQMQKISTGISPTENNPTKFTVDESDLSIRALEDLQRQLQLLQKEKSERLRQVMEHLNTLNELCVVLGVDFKETIREVHPSLDHNEASIGMSDDVINSLASTIASMRNIKLERMQKLQDLASTMLELWDIMDVSNEEQQRFQNVTCNIASLEQEITEPDALSQDIINHVEAEVSRLEQLKASRMKELVVKKKTELEEIRRRTHLVPQVEESEFEVDATEAGAIDSSLLLKELDVRLSTAKEIALSRKDILDKVDKWLAACDEEAWLEEYNMDSNRYSAGRGAHLTLKRAEKARALVGKIPAMVDNLANKVTTWENERGMNFIYDGDSLMLMLEKYTMASQVKEQERKRLRDMRKHQVQLIAEQVSQSGSKPSLTRTLSSKKTWRSLTPSHSQKMSLSTAAAHLPKPDFLNPKHTDIPKKIQGT